MRKQPLKQSEQEQLFEYRLPTQQPIQPKQRNWRRPGVIASVCVAMALLPVLAFLLVTWGENVYRAMHAAHVQTTAPLLVKQPAAGSAPSAGQIADQVDSLLTTQVNNQQFSGSVLIAQNGQVLLAKGYSQANWDTQTANTTTTRFYLGSVTKQFTATATLILQEQGKLHVEDKICSYITNCPPPWQPVTIQNLLTHTSGIPELDDSQLAGTSPQAWINSFNNAPLAFTPGGLSAYCSICYQILAYVVQQVAGMPYSQFIQQMILTPLHMNDSGFGTDYYSHPNNAIGYATWKINNPQIAEPADPQWSFLSGSGLLYSTVEDLYRWDQALSNNTLISQQTLDQAITPHVASTDLFPSSGYGYGWFITKSPVPGHRLVWHDGVLDGFRNYIGRYVDDNVTIIFLSNLSTVDPIALGHSLEQIVFAKPAGG